MFSQSPDSPEALITAAGSVPRALWWREAGAADLCCRTGQTLVRPQAGQRLVAGDGGQGATQASQRRRFFFTWRKGTTANMIEKRLPGNGCYTAGRCAPWWFQCARASLGSGLSMRECSRAARERPVSAEICSGLRKLVLLVEVRESVKHMLILWLYDTKYLFSHTIWNRFWHHIHPSASFISEFITSTNVIIL